MANTIVKRVVANGDNIGVLEFIAIADTSGDESDTVVLDASALSGATAINRIRRISGGVVGCTAILEWDATTDDVAFVLAEGNFDHYFERNPLKNPKSTGYTGDLTITTTGFTSAGDAIFFQIEFEK